MTHPTGRASRKTFTCRGISRSGTNCAGAIRSCTSTRARRAVAATISKRCAAPCRCLRSDWSVTAFAQEPLQIEGNQAQTYGLSSWLPWQGVGVPFFTDAYAVRSYYVTGFGMISAGDWTTGREQARRHDPRLY